jgi:enoyl-CoA hydratase
MSEALVLTERQGDCLIVRLNRPQDGNAINLAVAQSLAAIIETCRKDSSLRAVILTGSGKKFFCTGGDVKAYAKIETEAALNEVFDTIRALLDALEQLPCPVIAAINGYAIGGGAELSLACDFRVIEQGAQIGFPQSRLGILPGWNGISRLVPLVGRAAAAKMLFDGRRFDAEQALAAIRVVVSFGFEKQEVKNYTKYLDQVHATGIKRETNYGLVIGFLIAVLQAAYGFSFWIGSYFIEYEIYNDF